MMPEQRETGAHKHSMHKQSMHKQSMHNHNTYIDYSQLEPGDIGACKGSGILAFLHKHLFEPNTDRFHYFIVWRQYDDNDWIILESINKGLAVGLLSWYETTHVEFYRVNCMKQLRSLAPKTLIQYGRSWYDYLLAARLALDTIVILFNMVKKLKITKLRPADFKYSRNNALLCTEAVDIAYLSVGVSIIGDVLPFPSAYRQAEIDGNITYLGDNGYHESPIKQELRERRIPCYMQEKIITEGCRTQKI